MPETEPQAVIVHLDYETMAAVRAVDDASKPPPVAPYRQVPVLVSCLALLVSLLSSGATILNNRASSRSHDQDQLTSLVQDLTQLPGQLSTIQAQYAKNPTQERSIGGTVIAAQLVESQEALTLIHRLHDDVPAAEAYEVGVSLGASGSLTDAISMLALAARSASDPNTKSSAYRVWAGDLYSLGNVTAARAKFRSALNAYNAADVTTAARTQNRVFTELNQVPYEVAAHNCTQARSVYTDAVTAMASLAATSASRIQDTLQAVGDVKSVNSCTS